MLPNVGSVFEREKALASFMQQLATWKGQWRVSTSDRGKKHICNGACSADPAHVPAHRGIDAILEKAHCQPSTSIVPHEGCMTAVTHTCMHMHALAQVNSPTV